MSVWIIPAHVGKNDDYYYELDRALDTLKTIFWGQSKNIKNIDVGDIVYMYETPPVSAIGWRCKVLAVKVPPQNVDIDDSEFEHGYGGTSDYYIKITVIGKSLGKYDDESRAKLLSLLELRRNGLNPKFHMQDSFRPKGQLLVYINSIEPSVVYDG